VWVDTSTRGSSRRTEGATEALESGKEARTKVEEERAKVVAVGEKPYGWYEGRSKLSSTTGAVE
jgi:hypothetical protein